MEAADTPSTWTSLPPEVRAADLVSRMTLEKVSQMVHTAPAIPRLGVRSTLVERVPHGVAAPASPRSSQAIGLAATWNVDLMHRVAVAISDEARATPPGAPRE